MGDLNRKRFATFLSHSHEDAEWVQQLARRLEDECGFRIWLDRWCLVPGASWQQEIALGLDQAESCVICIGSATPSGWFLQEIERALDIQAKDPHFRVIPLLLRDASEDNVQQFLRLRTWADFRKGKDQGYAFHVLKCGIEGKPPERWPPDSGSTAEHLAIAGCERKLQEFQRLCDKYPIRDQLVIEYQRKILDQWFEK